MKTDTPRTDAATTGKAYGIPGNTVSATFARQLETELAQLRAQLEGMVNGHAQDQKHVEKLEREVDRLHGIEHKCQVMGRELHDWKELCERFVPAVLPHHNAEDPVLGCAGCEALAAYEQLKGQK